ncbi:DUF1253-domain-containing protein [Zopfia rhizophila CBS 207.26]|uniref:U3 small nucleolar RNA-associated protein 25 n=1 Tax=Zopfia rhizophila CBS 207.26 TaxID=1314779 RepID=A0A6A6E568_9PEZI|nr:DUF1253-domain-containing protein [Zopfia rhizophila CBS 207.26]
MAAIRGREAFRGRGRGRRNIRGGRKNGFASGRVEEPPGNGESDVSDVPESEPEVEPDVSDQASADEEDAQPTGSAYHALLQAFQQAEAKDKPRRKRRKLDHPTNIVEEVQSIAADLDEVEETSPADEEEVAEVAQEDDLEEDEDTSDPFEVHFANPDQNELSQRLKAISDNQWTMERLKTSDSGKCVLQTPFSNHKVTSRRKLKTTRDIKLKHRLVSNAENVLGQFSDLEQAIVPSIFDHQDILFGGRTVQNAGRLRHITSLHALNHIFNTRDRIIKNNAKIAREQDDEDIEFRDQGFTRPKVLFLLETKQSCVRTVEAMTQLCDFEQQENKKRFLDSFSLPEDKFSDDKPEDFRELFEGNDENEFRIGMKFTRKTVKFFSKFYNSDVILASALGLRRAIESGDPKKKGSDFLSSIELVIMDHADAAFMQNWEHTEYVFEHLNLQPKDAHGCDFSRVRNWYLDGHAANLRQTIILSSYFTPKINALFNKHAQNVAGRLRYTPDYTTGIIETLNLGIKQTFSRFDSPSFATDPDARFKYFTSTIIPQLTRLQKPAEGGQGILIFIPSYLDFVRVRNYFAGSTATQNISFGAISEYVDPTDVRRARSHFMTGRQSMLLYTGRVHHFHRYNIRGVKRVVFYGIPENAAFYKEVVGFVGASLGRGEVRKRDVGVRVTFSRWERMELERVVGGGRVGMMVGGGADVFDFV